MSPHAPSSNRPYDLGSSSHAAFLPRLRAFADEFLVESENRLGEVVDGHIAYLEAGNEEPPRSRGEYAVELLAFGLLRREYGALAMSTPSGVVDRLAELWKIRSGDAARKPEADRERANLFRELLRQAGQGMADSVVDDAVLVRWLSAIGEFEQEALRMETWLASTRAFWSPEEFAAFTDGFADWFTLRARQALGEWTSGADDFRHGVLSALPAREDLFLISRPQSLYHMNMLGAEVMNRGFLPGYVQRPSKVVLVPGCMRSLPEGECRARREGLDISCTRCRPDCEVASLDRLAHERGFRVFVVPHASSFTAWLHHWRNDSATALVAAACPLHLISGGYEMRALGLQAQCVLLDYSGCDRHWVPGGISTRLDKSRLIELLENSPQGSRPNDSMAISAIQVRQGSRADEATH